jgi:hypothetical protein
MGHNFGLYHSHTVDCGTSVTCSNGILSEYGDWIDTMGASQPGHFNAFQKERLGWLNAGTQPPITTVTSGGTYQIGPYESQDGNPKALKILQSGTSNSYYYVEYRQANGQDSFLSTHPDILNGVVIHLASPSDSNSSDLLDLTPSSPSTFSIPALVVGQSFTDSTAGITITPTAVNSTGATVQVTLGSAACTNANPTVSISPLQSQYVTAGTPVNFIFTVKDNDSSSCASSIFTLGEALPLGWNGAWNTSTLSLSPGASASATLTVTSPTGTPDGFYNVAASASNTKSAPASASATYVISTPLPLSLSVSTDRPAYSAGQTVTVRVSVLSGTSPDAGASVTVNISTPTGRAKTLTSTTGSDGVASVSYRLSKRAAVGSYQVQASMPSSGASATIGASTVFVVQ